jgi:hypothetical protein
MDELTLFHELTLFRDFRSDTPGPSAAETEAAKARLLDAIAGQGSAAPRPTSSQRLRARLGPFARTRFWAPVAAAAAVTAIAITVALLAVPGSTATPKPKPSPVSSVHPRHHAPQRKPGAAKPAGGHGPAGGADGTHAGAGAAGSAAPGATGAPGPDGSAPATATPPTPTTTTLTANFGQVSPGHTVTLTATVTDQAGGGLSGGTVTFTLYPNETVSPASALNVCSGAPVTDEGTAGDNVATCTYTPSNADVGTYLVRAAYNGYRQYEPSDSAAASLTVAAIPTATTLTSVSPGQASPGQTVTLTATVRDQAGDNLSGGTVGFFWSGGSVGGISPAGDLNMCLDSPLTYNPATHANVATCHYTIPGTMSAGTLDMQAEYGDPSGPYPESISSVVVFTVES